MKRMQRTQVYLQPEVNAALKRLAQERGLSKAALLRLAAQRLIDQELAGDNAVLGLIGLGHGGPGKVSEDHDQVLADYSSTSHLR